MARPELPVMLFKKDGDVDWNGEMVQTYVAHDEEEYDIAVADGWQLAGDYLEGGKKSAAKKSAE